jgi:hypothetical protein
MNGDAMPGEYKDRVKFGMRAFAVAMVPLTMNFSSVRDHTQHIHPSVSVLTLA